MRVGRGEGSGKGKTSGRGHKGQMARKGAHHREFFEGGQIPLYRRLPKRGFNHENKCQYAPVNVGLLSRFEDGSTVTLDDLRAAGLANGVINGVKILGMGDLDRKLTVQAQAFSAVAREKIEKAGGQCEIVNRIV
jgi:large subunit ribosomal protein L15